MNISLLLFTLSSFRLAFLARKLRDVLSVRIIPIRLISVIILGGGLLVLTICAPPVISGLEGPEQFNSLFRRNDAIVEILLLDIFINFYMQAVFDFLADNILFARHDPSVPSGFMVLLVLHDRRS